MSESIRRLGEISRIYEDAASRSESVYAAAAEAEAKHRAEKAKAVLRFRAEGARSIAEAETRADADDEIAALYQARLMTAAVAVAHKSRLTQLREQIATGRTAVVDERAVDQNAARGYTGAA